LQNVLACSIEHKPVLDNCFNSVSSLEVIFLTNVDFLPLAKFPPLPLWFSKIPAGIFLIQIRDNEFVPDAATLPPGDKKPKTISKKLLAFYMNWL
jgi:hypothetical protein